MAKRRELLAAGIVRDLWFRNQHELDIYTYRMEQKKIQYRIIEKVPASDEGILVRILSTYSNHGQLIQLFDN